MTQGVEGLAAGLGAALGGPQFGSYGVGTGQGQLFGLPDAAVICKADLAACL